MENKLYMDKVRYSSAGGGKIPKFQYYFRKCQQTDNFLLKLVYKLLLKHYREKYSIELFSSTDIGGGLYIGHPCGITINSQAKIGKNVNIHKGVTIGRENRGLRAGVPTVCDEVWIGINATIVGNVKIGNDVLIAPNCFVNCDIPDHSVVIGNPCTIHHRDNATEGYINNKA